MAATKVDQLQLLQQNLQSVLVQKQQFEEEVTEIDSAITELGTTPQAYKIVGRIMLATSTERLLEELREKKEILRIRLTNFIKQEEMLKKNIEKAQQEVLGELKKKNAPAN